MRRRPLSTPIFVMESSMFSRSPISGTVMLPMACTSAVKNSIPGRVKETSFATRVLSAYTVSATTGPLISSHFAIVLHLLIQ